MKSISTPTIVFAIFLSIWVHVTICTPSHNPKNFDEFLKRLEKTIEESSVDVLPFTVKDHIIEKLKETPVSFHQRCAEYENESKCETGIYSPISSLNKAVSLTFHEFRQSNPSKESKSIINEIETVDPIGLLSYLSKKNESGLSPTFMKSVEEFRKTEYKKVPIVAGSIYSVRDFLEFIQRIRIIIGIRMIKDSSTTSNILPFLLQVRVIANLWKTSNAFKLLCVENENKEHSPVSALNRTISSTFDQYKQRTKGNEKMLKEIQSVDPIGLNVYLTKKHVTILSPNFSQTVKEFHQTMIDRKRLFLSGTNDSFIEPSFCERKTQLEKIPENIRKEITTEYRFLSHETIDFFIGIVMEQFEVIKMFSVTNYHNIDKYQPHNSSKTNDIQILYSGEIGSETPGHAVCIYYHASTQKVLVYDSAMKDKLDPTQNEIVRKLYPYNTGIIFQRPKTRQGAAYNCAVYAITYAAALLLGNDPAKHAFKSNDVCGEDGLYLRLYILEMFANRKLILMK